MSNKISLRLDKKKWQFCIDRGGTFTDIIAISPQDELLTDKILSENSNQYDDAAIEGIRRFLKLNKNQKIPSKEISVVKMGTTVATNALLERKGSKTLLVVNDGFRDALRIGYQNRPDLFALNIHLPEQLYHEVIELPGRVDAHGDTITAVNKELAKKEFKRFYDTGIRSIAIVLMHSYRYKSNEKLLFKIARDVGFPQISVSHKVSPLIKFISRGDITVIDAYLSPILDQYIKKIQKKIPGVKLMFMKSNGGLTEAQWFRGKDSILSGPAGGIVGAIDVSKSAGFKKIIGFDMGGTSTDVSHFSGSYERTFDTQISGIRVRAPMMKIHTVAAGGGSVLFYDGARFRVGPDSAGANPGPASYGKGGPLTVTDANIILGRIQPKYFPKSFGVNSQESLNYAIVRDKFEALAARVSLSVSEVAEGFIKIANENMANAIKKISIQRGYDVTKYVLTCFGGAAGQHACMVADLLGMEVILIPPMAGVLSAYGIGLAQPRTLKEISFEKPLNAHSLLEMEVYFRDLKNQACHELVAQGIQTSDIVTNETLYVRYLGTNTSIELMNNDLSSLITDFESQHRHNFGFIYPDRSLVVETLVIEAVGKLQKSGSSKPLHHTEDTSNNLDEVTMIIGSQEVMVRVYERKNLIARQMISGPAIIVDQNNTIVIDPGWRANITESHDVVVKRYKKKIQKTNVKINADPIMLEVFNNLFMSIAEQMGAVLEKTSSSVNIKERLDFSCAIFDSKGALIANAPHMPIHLGSMGESVRAILKKRGDTMLPGQVYALNDPYDGGTHLPDVTVITPIFNKENDKPMFFVGSRGHQADIGGITPGSMPPNSNTIHEEGILVTNFLLVENYIMREEELRVLLTSGDYPARNVDQNISDFKALVASNERGVQEIKRIIKDFGLPVVDAYMTHIRNNASESVCKILELLPDGKFKSHLDDGSKIKVSVKVDKQNRKAVIDFTGTSKQTLSNFNAPTAVCRAAVLYVFRCLVQADIPLNDGCLDPIEIIIPEGSLLSPKYPAAIVAGNVETSQAITAALFGAMNTVAASQGTMNNFTFGNAEYQYYETICGGSGAGNDFEGCSAVHTHMTNTRLTDPEILETEYPVILEKFEIRNGSGGVGKYNGGCGVVREIKFRENMIASILSGSRINPPFGLAGGGSGKCGETFLKKPSGKIYKLGFRDQVDVETGDTIIIRTPGGGAFGNKI